MNNKFSLVISFYKDLQEGENLKQAKLSRWRKSNEPIKRIQELEVVIGEKRGKLEQKIHIYTALRLVQINGVTHPINDSIAEKAQLSFNTYCWRVDKTVHYVLMSLLIRASICGAALLSKERVPGL